jgi:hypothetical protein
MSANADVLVVRDVVDGATVVISGNNAGPQGPAGSSESGTLIADVATSGNTTLSGLQTIQGVTGAAGLRVLVRSQSSASQNGLYEMAAGAWTRSTDADSSSIKAGLLCYVIGGTHATKLFALQLPTPFTIDSSNIIWKRINQLPQGWYDPTDYGAVGDDTTDCTPYLQALFEDMVPPESAYTGQHARVVFPPGNFYFADHLHITRAVRFDGAGGTGAYSTATKLRFAAYKCLWMHSLTTSPDAGHGDGTVIKCFQIEGAHRGASIAENHTRWQANHAYSVGDKVAPLAQRSVVPTNNLAYYYECIKAGTSGATEPEWFQIGTGTELDYSEEWQANQEYTRASVVRHPSRFDVAFAACGQITASGIPFGEIWRSGSTMPAGFATAVAETNVSETGPDGTFDWVCVNASGKFKPDGGTLASPGGGVVWSRKTVAGVLVQGKGVIEDCYIDGFFCGICIVAGVWSPFFNRGYSPSVNANGVYVRRLHIQNCPVGLNSVGPDANANSFSDMDLVGNSSIPDDRRIGIIDNSFLGNRYFNVQMNGYDGAAVYIPNYTNMSAFFGMYQETNSGANDVFSAQASFWGGTVLGFTSTSYAYGVPEPERWRGVKNNTTLGSGINVKSVFHDNSSGRMYQMLATDTLGIGYAYEYQTPALGAGYWGMQYSGTWCSIGYSTARATEGYGHIVFVDGRLEGRTTADRRYLFSHAEALQYSQIKYGKRDVGDRAESNTYVSRGGFYARSVTTAGYDAAARVNGAPAYSAPPLGPAAAGPTMCKVGGYVYACVKDGTTAGSPPAFTTDADSVYRKTWIAGSYFELTSFCRPTTPNGYVYEVTAMSYTYGLSGSVEPTWPTTPGNTVVDGFVTWTCRVDAHPSSLTTDGTAVWQCMGAVAQYSRSGYIVPEGSVTTTDATLTVADNYGSVPSNSVAVYRVRVKAIDTATPDAAEFELYASYYRIAGAPVALSAPAVVSANKSGGAAAWTAVLALNGSNEVVVNVTGAAGKTIAWNAMRLMSP